MTLHLINLSVVETFALVCSISFLSRVALYLHAPVCYGTGW